MHLGLIKSSSLCTEIVQRSSPTETAVCALASLCLPRFLRSDGLFNYAELHGAAKLLVRCLDRLIELSAYPTADAAVSAFRTRSVGIGTQGLADVLAYRELSFTSNEARSLNKLIYETVYHASLESSSELAEILGTYDAWTDSPAHQGILQVDMWGGDTSSRYDFNALREKIRRFGLRNSVLTAQMPTATTAQLFGNSDGMNPHVRSVIPLQSPYIYLSQRSYAHSNIIKYRVDGTDFSEIYRPLLIALCKRGLWTTRIRKDILAARGPSPTRCSNIPYLMTFYRFYSGR